MLKFLVDEDLPRSTAHLLREMGSCFFYKFYLNF